MMASGRIRLILEQGLWQGCVLAPLLSNMFVVAVVLRVADKYFIADAAIIDKIVQLQRKSKGDKKRRKARAGKADQGGRVEIYKATIS